MSSMRPSLALPAMAGSQICARVMPTMSACPRATISSACWGWLMRPATKTGADTLAFTAAA